MERGRGVCSDQYSPKPSSPTPPGGHQRGTGGDGCPVGLDAPTGTLSESLLCHTPFLLGGGALGQCLRLSSFFGTI